MGARGRQPCKAVGNASRAVRNSEVRFCLRSLLGPFSVRVDVCSLVESRSAELTPADVSVVVASVEASRSIEDCLDAVSAAVRGRRAEVFVVDASRDGSADIAEEMLEGARVMRY